MRARLYIAGLLVFSLSSCSWIGRQADAAGEYMPVIGERCEYWQCITQGGQERSNAIKLDNEKQQRLTDMTKGWCEAADYSDNIDGKLATLKSKTTRGTHSKT